MEEKIDKHEEIIICPNCQYEQIAEVLHTRPYWRYIHVCECCGLTITESEWDNIAKLN